MSRSKLLATTLAAVCSVGAQGIANTSGPDKANQTAVIQPVPTEVLNFLGAGNAPAQSNVYLSNPLPIDAAPAICLMDIDLNTPRRVHVRAAREAPTAELPLVPLPSPLWTGTAGLIGLATIRGWKTIRKTLH
jgi:hypothetical protein